MQRFVPFLIAVPCLFSCHHMDEPPSEVIPDPVDPCNSDTSMVVEPVNVIRNPSFESADFWVLKDDASAFDTVHSRTGSRSISLVNDGALGHNVVQLNSPGVLENTEYQLTSYVKGVDVAGNGQGGKPLTVLKWKDARGNKLSSEHYMWAPYGTYDWKALKIHLQSPPGAAKVDITLRSWWDCTGGTTYWDDLELIERDLPKGLILLSFQAEEATTRSGGSIGNQETGFTGTGYFEATRDGALLGWTGIPGGGTRVLSVRYSIVGNPRKFELSINGNSQGQSDNYATGQRGSWASRVWIVELPPGENTVRLRIGSPGGDASPLIDRLDLHLRKSQTEKR